MIAHSNSANTPIICDASILPEPLEAIGGKLGVADGMLEGTMPEVSLQRPSIIFFGSGSGIEPTAIRFDDRMAHREKVDLPFRVRAARCSCSPGGFFA
jgi:hypothetical protein